MKLYQSLIDMKCPVCGKNFIPAPMHIYNDGGHGGGKTVCSWNCHIKAHRKREAEKMQKRHYRNKAIAPGRDAEIRKLASEGMSIKDIADRFGLGLERVKQIIREGLNM